MEHTEILRTKLIILRCNKCYENMYRVIRHNLFLESISRLRSRDGRCGMAYLELASASRSIEGEEGLLSPLLFSRITG